MNGCRVGVGRAEIVLTKPGPICGFGPGSTTRAKPPEDPDQRLFVTAVALEDASRERLVFINADLHCGGVRLWRAAVAAAGLDPSRVVLCGSHNHAGPYGTKADVTKTREFIEDLRAAIHAEFAKGTSPFVIPKTVRLPKYEHWDMYDEYLEMNAWRVLLDDWMGPFPWHATRAEEEDQ